MAPKDPFMLYSFINMKLRDQYKSIDELCNAENLDLSEVSEILSKAGFEYIREINQFR